MCSAEYLVVDVTFDTFVNLLIPRNLPLIDLVTLTNEKRESLSSKVVCLRSKPVRKLSRCDFKIRHYTI